MIGVEPAVGREARRARAAQLRGRLQRLGDLAERHRRSGRRALAHDLAVDDVERVRRLAAAARPPSRSPCSRTSTAASRVASPVITVTRDAKAPWPKAIRSVRPWTTRTRRVVDAERVGADLRHHGLDPLPDRSGAGDHLDQAGAVDRQPHAVERSEPALLDEDRQPRADAFAAGATAPQARPAARPTRSRRVPCRAGPHSRRSRARPRCRASPAAACRASPPCR